MNSQQITTGGLMPRPDIPQTEESIRLARENQKAERAEAERHGLVFDEDGTPRLAHKVLRMMPILCGGVPLDNRVACADAIDQAVEGYGLDEVIRCVRLVAAANGREL